jgi:hypothetical protein
MANEEYPFVSGVRSNLIEEQIKQESTPPSANTILVFGTAEKGPLNTPTRITPATAETIFGANINDPYQKFNLMKGFYEISDSMPGTEIIAVRIGNAKKSRLDLYESQVSSGNFAPQSTETISISLEAKTEGLEGNEVIATIYDDGKDAPYAIPSRLVIELPNGISKDFDLINDYKTSAELVAAINADADIATYLGATVNTLEGSENVTILAGAASGQITTGYTLSERDLIDITNVYTEGLYLDEGSIDAGRTTAELAKTPIKDTDENTSTIDKFWTIVTAEKAIIDSGEEAVGLAPGTTKVFPARASVTTGGAPDPKWIPNTGTDSLKDVVVYVKTTAGTVELATTAYTVNQATGAIELDPAADFEVGSTIIVDYKYLTQFTEANVRSSINTGNPYSYFVTGSTIIFGAGQSYPLEVGYQTKIQHTLSSVNLTTGEIIFALDGNQPSVGDSVKFEYVFNPELPGASGASVSPTSNRKQLSQLSGGTTGRKLTLPELYTELGKGYIAADNIPCRVVVPQGVYVDDTMEGLDFETGLPTTVNAGFHTQLSAYLARHSQYVSECVGIMSVKPMVSTTPTLPSLEERENWYTKLVTVSATDTTRAANVVAAINDYHLVVTAGDLIMSHPQIFGGGAYVEGAHNVVAAMKLNHDNLSSLITRNLPQSLIRGMQYKVVAADRINAINQARYTLVTEDSDTNALKLASAPTMALATSQFRKQYNLDITVEAVNTVRRAIKRFIGQPNKSSVRQAMKRLAEQKLQEMSPDKLLSAQVVVVATRAEAINGNLQIDLNLVTAVEIERINIRTKVELGF